MKKFLKRACGLLLLLLLLFAAGVFALCALTPSRKSPIRIDDPTGYVQAAGASLYDGNGDILQFRGVNLGNWFIQEFWEGVSSVGTFDTGLYTQVRGDAAMQANPNLTDEQMEVLKDLYIDNYIKEEDFALIAGLGMNTVRIPFTCYNITNDGHTLREDAFDKLDWAVEMCEKYGLYAVIDLHGAPGSQNQDIHSGDDSQFALYSSEENMNYTCELWKAIAAHFADNKTVAAYDLLNEPRSAPGKYGGKINFEFYDRLYQAVRTVDENHMILMECFTFPVHGDRSAKYEWDNFCLEYHIYNLTPFSQKTCLLFYKAMHNIMNYGVPVYVGEWNAFEDEKDWEVSFDFFDENGWSYTSWNYKANAVAYRDIYDNYCNWGLVDLHIQPVDLSTAEFDEIYRAYESVQTEYAEKTEVYDIWEKAMKARNPSS